MICSKCGKEIASIDARYCLSCGATYCKQCGGALCDACYSELKFYS